MESAVAPDRAHGPPPAASVRRGGVPGVPSRPRDRNRSSIQHSLWRRALPGAALFSNTNNFEPGRFHRPPAGMFSLWPGNVNGHGPTSAPGRSISRSIDPGQPRLNEKRKLFPGLASTELRRDSENFGGGGGRGRIGSGGRRWPRCEGRSAARRPEWDERRVDQDLIAARTAASRRVFKEGRSCYSGGMAGLQ